MKQLIFTVLILLFYLNSYGKKLDQTLIINIEEEIGIENSTEISEQILEYDTKKLYTERNIPLRIRINSNGGSIYGALGIIDTMTYSDYPIETECLDVAASSAAFILCMGTKGHRYAHKNSRILIHYATIKDKNIDDMSEQNLKELDSVNKEMLDLLSKNSYLSKEELKKAIDNANGELWLTADEALEYGLIDKILE